MGLNLVKTIVEILQSHPQQYYTARELAETIFELKPHECENKIKNSKATVVPIKDKEGLLNQLIAEIGARKKRIQDESRYIKMTADRPRRYYYSEKTDEQEIEEAEKIIKKNGHTEHDSYPLLCLYLYNELNIYPKRINEKKSSNSKGTNGNKWLHPDIVGVKNLSKDWSEDIIACANKHAFNKTSLWSFEVKIKVNLSNVREYFFQTVSNSSWANYSYLVAQDFTDEATMDELRILCSGHSIGVIKLNTNNPTESEILIPAKEKISLEWNMMNRISEENSDFRDYINLITEFYQTGKLKERDWDIPKE